MSIHIVFLCLAMQQPSEPAAGEPGSKSSRALRPSPPCNPEPSPRSSYQERLAKTASPPASALITNFRSGAMVPTEPGGYLSIWQTDASLDAGGRGQRGVHTRRERSAPDILREAFMPFPVDLPPIRHLYFPRLQAEISQDRSGRKIQRPPWFPVFASSSNPLVSSGAGSSDPASRRTSAGAAFRSGLQRTQPWIACVALRPCQFGLRHS